MYHCFGRSQVVPYFHTPSAPLRRCGETARGNRKHHISLRFTDIPLIFALHCVVFILNFPAVPKNQRYNSFPHHPSVSPPIPARLQDRRARRAGPDPACHRAQEPPSAQPRREWRERREAARARARSRVGLGSRAGFGWLLLPTASAESARLEVGR
jgi:hypothetical protein